MTVSASNTSIQIANRIAQGEVVADQGTVNSLMNAVVQDGRLTTAELQAVKRAADAVAAAPAAGSTQFGRTLLDQFATGCTTEFKRPAKNPFEQLSRFIDGVLGIRSVDVTDRLAESARARASANGLEYKLEALAEQYPGAVIDPRRHPEDTSRPKYVHPDVRAEYAKLVAQMQVSSGNGNFDQNDPLKGIEQYLEQNFPR